MSLIRRYEDVVLYRTARTLERAMKTGGHWTPNRDYARRTHADLPVWVATLPASASVHRLLGRIGPDAADFVEYDAVMARSSDWPAFEYKILRPEVLRGVHCENPPGGR